MSWSILCADLVTRACCRAAAKSRRAHMTDRESNSPRFFSPPPPLHPLSVDNPGNNVAFGVRGTYLSECIVGHGKVRDAQTRIIFYSFRWPFPLWPHISLPFPASLSLFFIHIHICMYIYIYKYIKQRIEDFTRPATPYISVRYVKAVHRRYSKQDFISAWTLINCFWNRMRINYSML